MAGVASTATHLRPRPAPQAADRRRRRLGVCTRGSRGHLVSRVSAQASSTHNPALENLNLIPLNQNLEFVERRQMTPLSMHVPRLCAICEWARLFGAARGLTNHSHVSQAPGS